MEKYSTLFACGRVHTLRFVFSFNGIKSEATPNTGMIRVADGDLSLLSELHSFSSARNLRDRHKGVYELKSLTKEEETILLEDMNHRAETLPQKERGHCRRMEDGLPVCQKPLGT